jgi:hypothetical protein
MSVPNQQKNWHWQQWKKRKQLKQPFVEQAMMPLAAAGSFVDEAAIGQPEHSCPGRRQSSESGRWNL